MQVQATAGIETVTLSPIWNYTDQSPKRSGGFLYLVDRRRGGTSAHGCDGKESVLADGEVNPGESAAGGGSPGQLGKTLSTPLGLVGFEATSVVSSSAIAGDLGKGAKSDVETVLSWPPPRRITEYVWLPSTSSTGSHKGSPLFRTWRRRRMGPGCNNHEGTAEPVMALRGNRRKYSWGVSLAERQTRDQTAWRASGRTVFQRSSERLSLCSNSFIVRQIVWLERSHWLFPCGWYGVEVLQEMPRVVRKDLDSRDTKGAPLSLCTQPGKPNKQNSDDKHSDTVDDFIFLHGKTNGKRECSSMTISRYGWGPDTGPLKSTHMRSHGRTDLIKIGNAGLKIVVLLQRRYDNFCTRFWFHHLRKVNYADEWSDKNEHSLGDQEICVVRGERFQAQHYTSSNVSGATCSTPGLWRMSKLYCPSSSRQQSILVFFILPWWRWSNMNDMASWSVTIVK